MTAWIIAGLLLLAFVIMVVNNARLFGRMQIAEAQRRWLQTERAQCMRNHPAGKAWIL